MSLRSIAALALLAALAACGGKEKIGTGLTKSNLDGGGRRIGQITPSPKPTPPPTPTPRQNATPTPQPQRQATPTTPPQASVEVFITVNGIEPNPDIVVPAGGVLKVTNRDSVARSIVALHGEFNSGPIKPGESWYHRFDDPGTFEFQDGTRPYVVGRITVQ